MSGRLGSEKSASGQTVRTDDVPLVRETMTALDSLKGLELHQVQVMKVRISSVILRILEEVE